MGWHIFEFFWVRQFFIFTVGKRTRMFVLQMKSKVFFIQFKKRVKSKKEKVTELESRKLHMCPKVTLSSEFNSEINITSFIPYLQNDSYFFHIYPTKPGIKTSNQPPTSFKMLFLYP